MKNIDSIIEKIKSSPLFYLFLSSKELFHSNFWFWLSTLNKHETLKLFTDKKIDGNLIYTREHTQTNGEFKSSVDLLIESNTLEKVVIENKVKDFPKLEQLERIKNSFGAIKPELVLTTLFWTEDLAFKGWTVQTYRNISNAIRPEKYSDNRYYQELIADYKEFVLNLALLSEQLEIKQKYDFANSWNDSLFKKLNQIKLWEGYQRLRASHLLFHFNKLNTHELTTSYCINHQKATIDFTINLKNDYKIGIEIEDTQYRKFISGSKGDKFADNLVKHNIFFSDSFCGRGGKRYLNYKNQFKYQYEKIPIIISFSDLFDKINSDFTIIIDELYKIREHIP